MRDFGSGDVWFLVRAAQWTLLLSATAFVGGGLLGAALALARISRSRLLRLGAAMYIQVFQGTPLLVQLFIWFFGLSLFGADLPPLAAAGLALTLNSAAFFAEIWQGSLGSIPKGQWESAASLGLSRMQQLGWIIVPQAIRIALPPTAGLMVQIVKNTSLTALIGFVELVRAGQLVNNATFEPAASYLIVGAIYFVICFPLSMLSRALERRLHGGRRTLQGV